MNRDARWYTAARRFPQLIGRTPDGSKIPFGPFTILQLVVAGGVGVVLWNTPWLWARFGLIWNLVFAGGVLFGSVWAAGRLPFGLRNPLVVVGGWLTAIDRMSAGGRTQVRLPKPQLPRHGQVLMITPLADFDDAPAAGELDLADQPTSDLADPVHAPTPAAAPAPGPVLSGVQRLLAQASTS